MVGITGKFSMAKRRDYRGKDGSSRVAHNLEIKIMGEGTGDFYVSEDVYSSVIDQGVKDGDFLTLVVEPRLFMGRFSFHVVKILPADVAAD